MSIESKRKQCSRCVMDSTTHFIDFNQKGVCNYCRGYEGLAAKYINVPKEKKENELNFIINSIKRFGRGKKYDCILGLSGGVDSSYLAVLAKEKGLRPLFVHFDNGWNSDIAVNNIHNLVNKLDYELYTYVIDWENFKDLQRAYMLASVKDTEVPNDFYIFAILYHLAEKFKIKYILSGYNYVTEWGIPQDWNYPNKWDETNLKNIHAKFGLRKLKDFPKFNVLKRFFYEKIKVIETVTLLNQTDYNKAQVKRRLMNEYEWKDYGGKHYESIFTRFYQGYLLPNKFGIDKRKAHLSALIRSGQINKEDALKELSQLTYDLKLQQEDLVYVIKKLNFTESEFQKILTDKPVAHEFYGTDVSLQKKVQLLQKLLNPIIKICVKIKFIKATGKWSIPQ